MTHTEYILRLHRTAVVLQRANGPEFLSISFKRTVRVPDNHDISQLPSSFGDFPLFKVEDYRHSLPSAMGAKGGLFMPMYQREAMWINFTATSPFMIKIYAGGVNVVSGEHCREDRASLVRRKLQQNNGKCLQDYIVVPEQLWLDGVAIGNGIVKQFVAMPVGQGYSVEAQLTHNEVIGGLQFEVTPMKRVVLKLPPGLQVDPAEVNIMVLDLTSKFDMVKMHNTETVADLKNKFYGIRGIPPDQQRLILNGRQLEDEQILRDYGVKDQTTIRLVLRLRGGGGGEPRREMSIAAGGRIHQAIMRDPHDAKQWHNNLTVTFNLQILDSLSFKQVTGIEPPQSPITAKDYAKLNLPFFQIYEEKTDIQGDFKGLKSIAELDGVIDQTHTFRTIQIDSKGHRTAEDTNPEAKLVITDLVDDPDKLMNKAGPFSPFRTTADLESTIKQLTLDPDEITLVDTTGGQSPRPESRPISINTPVRTVPLTNSIPTDTELKYSSTQVKTKLHRTCNIQ